jgi:hypothetical protein
VSLAFLVGTIAGDRADSLAALVLVAFGYAGSLLLERLAPADGSA